MPTPPEATYGILSRRLTAWLEATPVPRGAGYRRETALQKTAGVTRREEKSNLKSLD
jgi:hypothetical protein